MPMPTANGAGRYVHTTTPTGGTWYLICISEISHMRSAWGRRRFIRLMGHRFLKSPTTGSANFRMARVSIMCVLSAKMGCARTWRRISCHVAAILGPRRVEIYVDATLVGVMKLDLWNITHTDGGRTQFEHDPRYAPVERLFFGQDRGGFLAEVLLWHSW